MKKKKEINANIDAPKTKLPRKSLVNKKEADKDISTANKCQLFVSSRSLDPQHLISDKRLGFWSANRLF